MTAFRLNTETNKVQAFATLREAESQGNSLPIFTTESELFTHDGIELKHMVALYNSLADKEVKRFSDRAAGAKRTWAALVTAHKELPAPKPEKEKAPKIAKEKGRPKGTGEFAGKTLVALKEVNPRQFNTWGWKSYEILRGKPDGLTYADYIAAGGRNNDLRWDIERKRIKVID